MLQQQTNSTFEWFKTKVYIVFPQYTLTTTLLHVSFSFGDLSGRHGPFPENGIFYGRRKKAMVEPCKGS